MLGRGTYFNEVQAGLNFTILLPQPSKYWDYRHVPPGPALLPIFTRKSPVIADKDLVYSTKSRSLCSHCSTSVTREPFRFVPR